MIPPPEITMVDTPRVACSGNDVHPALGHPRVYLEMGGRGFVECGYCDRRFVLAGHVQPEDERFDPGAYDPGDTPEA